MKPPFRRNPRRVITAILPTLDAERLIVPTLSALVAGAADGILRQVIIADAGSRDATLEIVDQAGCDAVTAASRSEAIRLAAGQAKGSWLLFLLPGTALEEGWVREVKHFIEQTEMRGLTLDRGAVFRHATDQFSERTAVVEALLSLREALRTRPRPEQGLLIAQRLYRDIGGHRVNTRDAERDLLSRLGRRRIVRLRTRNLVG
jgi:glycosyltransferase involved in cell wall biosynthesis